jgi:4-aminobutyrate aminotransferase-like enzyme
VKPRKYQYRDLRLSLADLVGFDYCRAVVRARALLTGEDERSLSSLIEDRVGFWPDGTQARLEALLPEVGRRVCDPVEADAPGGAATSFRKASHLERAPLSGLGFIRIGQDGRAYLLAKSEHYHASMGHSFPGYRLLENARRLGIPNATHNNTRGHITRLLEWELIRAANGLAADDADGLQAALAGTEEGVLNRVINLQTGSLAVEAGLKMMLARFTRSAVSNGSPVHAGKTPVFLVMADANGEATANYHGTTFLAQMLRGMWPRLYEAQRVSGAFLVRPVRINDLRDFARAVEEHDGGSRKVAGFLHEIVLMNYGGIRLEESYLRDAYRLCRERGIPVLVDEIQSCVWSPEVFLFREYGLQPDLVAVGKGFPGGEYASSRILTTAEMDSLNQFDALVTNGQEEIASLSYLVTLAFVRANGEAIRSLGEYYESRLRALAEKHQRAVAKIEGLRHMTSIFFHSAEEADRFASLLNDQGIDISAQTYKAECPPACLTKLPLISTPRMVDFLVEKMDGALNAM